jgi:hypothetical protein
MSQIVRGRLAAGFAALFGLGHLAWAVGWPVLGATPAQYAMVDIRSLSHLGPTVGLGLLSLVAAGLTLALVEPWGCGVPRLLRRLTLWLGVPVAAVCAGYGLLGLGLMALQAVGAFEFPTGHHVVAAGWWFYWYGLFLAVGASFLLTAWGLRRGRP